jgi:hypothetical protein
MVRISECLQVRDKLSWVFCERDVQFYIVINSVVPHVVPRKPTLLPRPEERDLRGEHVTMES